jgi:hypothetical protein
MSILITAPNETGDKALAIDCASRNLDAPLAMFASRAYLSKTVILPNGKKGMSPSFLTIHLSILVETEGKLGSYASVRSGTAENSRSSSPALVVGKLPSGNLVLVRALTRSTETTVPRPSEMPGPRQPKRAAKHRFLVFKSSAKCITR